LRLPEALRGWPSAVVGVLAVGEFAALSSSSSGGGMCVDVDPDVDVGADIGDGAPKAPGIAPSWIASMMAAVGRGNADSAYMLLGLLLLLLLSRESEVVGAGAIWKYVGLTDSGLWISVDWFVRFSRCCEGVVFCPDVLLPVVGSGCLLDTGELPVLPGTSRDVRLT